MKKIILMFCLVIFLTVPVRAMEFDPPEVPESGEQYMPQDTQTFAEGLWYVIRSAIEQFLPEISESAVSCMRVFAVMILVTVVDVFPGASNKAVHLAATVFIGLILLQPSNAFIQLGAETVTSMTEYGKLLFPVLAGALAAQGAVSASAAVYAGSAFFSSVLSTIIVNLVLPLLYSYFCLCIVDAATGDSLLKDLKNFSKWLISWVLKTVLYVFTAYIGITGIVSGTVDASAVKIAKLTISGMVPVVGSIISDASETILISAGVMKNAAGIYGILASIAIFVGPLVKIGAQYLLLKITAYICAVFSSKQESELLKDFSGGLGLVLAMTGAVCLLLLISAVCFMKGVS